MKTYLSILVVCFVNFLYSQVGINTESPKVTLEVVAQKNDGTNAEGLLPPRLTGDVLRAADIKNIYGNDQNGTVLFVTEAASPLNRLGQTIDVNSSGLYYFDSILNKWVRFCTSCGNGFSVNCESSKQNKFLNTNTSASTEGIEISINYTGGAGEAYAAQSVSSTGLTGFTATLESGNLAVGDGTLIYKISGSSSQVGVAKFPIKIIGKSCVLILSVGCGAFVAEGDFRGFMCYNLGADTDADFFTPNAAVHGAKYQWGAYTGQIGRYLSQAEDQSNSGVVSTWNRSVQFDNTLWRNSEKTINDPCPSGYRVPTSAQWQGVLDNNTLELIGTWGSSPTNYSSAMYLKNASNVRTLMLPAAGFRDSRNGSLGERGYQGDYASSSASGNASAFAMYFYSFANGVGATGKAVANSVRCIME